MSNKVDLDQLRSRTLERIERSERNFKLAFYAALIFEALFLLSFLLLMNPHERLHLLLLIATISSYTIVLLGLVALGAHINRGNLRVLKAIEMLKEQTKL
ncbi:MAG: hypothetical protein M3268_04155 [Acidobacteriota bacterium]|nr:hypothetical protein [Acidobacteriota bacterium]